MSIFVTNNTYDITCRSEARAGFIKTTHFVSVSFANVCSLHHQPQTPRTPASESRVFFLILCAFLYRIAM